MKKKRSALFTSLLALLLCVSMLMGTTLAWFTDSVSSQNNQILAGSLDVELEQFVDGKWVSVNESTNVFEKDALWEPGRTEVVYLRVRNAGDLALKYGFGVNVASETGSVNVLGNEFKLSDHIRYGIVLSDSLATYADRASARAALQVSQLINQAYTSDAGSLLPAGEKYVTLVVYMPEEVGNEANYATGAAIPTVNLGLRLMATQEVHESDAFGSDYDASAEIPGFDFPDTNVSDSASTKVDTDGAGKVSEAVTMQGSQTAAEVPAGVQLEGGATELKLTVNDVDQSQANLTLGDNESQRSVDVHIEGVAADNTVPMTITLRELAPKGLNMGNYKLYHVEGGVAVEMSYVASDAAFSAHNQFKYDPATGDVVLHMATFSEVAVVADTIAAWKGSVDHSWYIGKEAPYTIANADQLWSFSQIVGGMTKDENGNVIQDSFAGKTVKLTSDINLGDDEENNVANKIFYPIGYYNSDVENNFEKRYEKTGEKITSSLKNFCGTFDGQGHTVSNFYHNTWEMKGDHDWYSPEEQYYRDGMGLFGRVYKGTVKNLTVSNFSSDGEIATTGVIAAYADGATFENIAIFNCNPRVYNIGNGGIVGCVGWYAKEAGLQTTFKNITVDNSNKISALWGSYDVACGGIVGQYYPTSGQTSAGTPKNGGIDLVNCHVAAQMDVYNDVCGNYQYYAYRYAGMLIGSVRENETINGHVYPKMDGITAKDCTVNYGTWNDYYYCELEKNGHPSYAGENDYKFSRLENVEKLPKSAEGTKHYYGKDESGNMTCRHFIDGKLHEHTAAEDNQAIYLPFDQLFTGYGWGVTSKGLKDYEGAVDIGKEKSVVKFAFKENIKALQEGKTYTLKDLFSVADSGVAIVDSAVTIGITNLDENGNVTATVGTDDNWQDKTVKFTGTGNVEIIIQDYQFCIPTVMTVEIANEENIETVTKFNIKFPNVDKYLYRVGNLNPVPLNALFTAVDGAKIGDVTVISTEGDVNIENGWESGTIDLSGYTGLITVTIQDNDYCEPTVLELEVVDAVNVITATSATKNNVVLLNDCGFNSLEVSGGYTLYGNGFTMTCGSDSAALDMGYSFVTLNNGTLDNVQIVCPNFDYAVLYKSNMTESGNRSETTDRTRYFNVKSGVMASGNSQILNSRISGGRAAVNVSGGNVVIDNSRIELGAVASILVGAANSLKLRDVTLVQKPTASTYDSSKTLMGFSVLFVCDANGDAAPVTLEGTLVQNAWVNENYKQYVPSAGQSIISTVLGKTDYLHDLNNDGTKESLNLGFAYMPESLTSKVNTTTITDNRTNKDTVPYDYAEISILNGKTYVYSYKNTNSTADSFKTESDYAPNKQGDIITVTYADSGDGLESSKSFGTGGWVFELNVDLDKLPGYALDFSKLSMSVNGVAITEFKVNGNAKPTSPVAVTAGGVTYTLTATVNGKEYTATYKVTGTETSKESPSLVAANYEAGLCVASSHGGTWHGAAPALQGIQIKYWSVAEKQYKTINLSDYTPTTKGQLNGTNTTWTYSPANGDFTLTLTGGQVHSGNKVYAMPVVCDGKLYFVAAKSNGLVNSGNSARTIPVSYTFKDNNNGEVLTFSHTWSVAENKDAQYKYSDFCSGTLTKLEASSSGGGSCVTGDTLITLADGSQVRVDALTGNEELLVWDFFKGEYTVVPSALIVDHGFGRQTVIKLTFADGTTTKAITAHSYFDADTNKWELITADNAYKYVGHEFVQADGSGYTTVKLIDTEVYQQYSRSYSLVSALHYNFITDDMFSLTNSVHNMLAGLEVGEDMTYDVKTLQSDMQKYGTYTYADFADYITYQQYVAFNGDYLKISVEKGYITFDEILVLIDTYLNAN